MTESQKLELRRSKVRERLTAISLLEGDAYSDEIQTEERALQTEFGQLEVRQQTAILTEDAALEAAKAEAGTGNGVDAETRERLELRAKATVSGYLVAAARGRAPDGAEAELAAAAGVTGIPIEIFELDPREVRTNGEVRAVTPAPGVTGINLDPVRPAVFANSIASRLSIDMPRVPSGTFASATISTSQSAAAKPKAPDADAPAVATAGVLTVSSATPKRISARLELAIEDIAAVGQENFESSLRQNLALALSDELDDQMINGDGAAPNLSGIFEALSNPGAPAAGVASFDKFIETFADGIDGLWSSMANEVSIVVNPETYRLSLKTFRDASGQDLGGESFADYAMEHFGGWWTNARMPAKANHVAQAILFRQGRSMMGGAMAMRTAVCPHWGTISIDDIYSGSASGVRAFTLNVLVGDVILVQPAAYKQVSFRVTT